MEDPFFPNPWNTARRAHFNPYHQRPAPPRAVASKPKVVSIPVHFVGSDDQKVEEEKKKKVAPSATEREAAAMRIQRVFRGFVVRKNVRAVRRLAVEAEEMERRVAEDEEVLRREERERMRVNEMLMKLLLRLDTVRGARAYRRKVIRRVIALQERVDSISAAQTPEEQPSGPVGDSAAEIVGETEESPASHSKEENPNSARIGGGVVSETLESETRAEETSSPVESIEEAPETVESEVTAEEASLPVDSIEEEAPEVKGLARQKTLEAPEEVGRDETSTVPMEDTREAEGAVMEKKAPAGQTLETSRGEGEGESLISEGVGIREVMERVAVESERLRGLVAELCERSVQQCRMMDGLAERVEHLERVVQRMERCKKKRRAGSALSSAVDKKCGPKQQ